MVYKKFTQGGDDFGSIVQGDRWLTSCGVMKRALQISTATVVEAEAM